MPLSTHLRQFFSCLVGLPRRVHCDERGSVSIASVFALLLLVMLLGMVINTSRQVDQKVKMQNAADAATYSGGVVMARGLNTLAFSNHLLSDVFALTAFLREARDRSSESLTPEILDNWERIGPAFASSEFPKFADLGRAITEKVPLEREMVRAYSEWAFAAQEMMLPVMEDILQNRRIPEFQRAVVRATPRLAQYAADETARRHGRAWPNETVVRALLWRADGEMVGGANEDPLRRSLPVVDPVEDGFGPEFGFVTTARSQRRRYAKIYLNQWNNEMLVAFDRLGQMSQFSNLWRIFTCGQLERLLEEEYPYTNLPHLIRPSSRLRLRPDGTPDHPDGYFNAELERDHVYVGVAYRKRVHDTIPGVFRNPVSSDTLAYAQIMTMVPKRRLVWYRPAPPPSGSSNGGVPGQTIDIPGEAPAVAPADEDTPRIVVRQSYSYHPDRPNDWDLRTQNWTVQIVPATTQNLPLILSTPPEALGDGAIQTPDLRNLTAEDMQWLSHH